MSKPTITTIDCEYTQPKYAAAFLVEAGEKNFFVENNTAHSVPLLLKALAQRGVKPEEVHYVIITHVHLDHAGGSSALLKACPNATLLAHPRAAPHIIDPTRLVTGARAVYGDEAFNKLYGTIEPVPAARVRVMEDEEVLDVGSVRLRFFFTRGHANHHFCIQMTDEESKSVVFTGDSFGLAYPILQSRSQAAGLFIFPSTSPVDFDAEEARKSIRKIATCGADQALLTHFGSVDDIGGAAEQLLAAIDFSDALLNEAQVSLLSDDQLKAYCEAKLHARMANELGRRGISLRDEKIADLLRLDLDLNAAGLAHVAKKRRHPSKVMLTGQ